jgi:ABC-type amino acid transport substrate-binding protein
MAIKKGRCINIGNCKISETKQIVSVPENSDFVCPECGMELRKVEDRSPNPTIWKKYVIPVISILIIFIIIVIYENHNRNAKSNPVLAKNDSAKVQARNDHNLSHIGILNRILNNKDGGINIAMEEESIPMYYFRKDNNGNDIATGFGYEFAEELAKRLGTKKHVISAPFPDLPKRLYSGDADVIIAGETKDTGMADVLWSDSYLENGLCLIVNEGSAITDYKQLSGKKVGLFKGDQPTKDWVIQNIPNVIIDDSHLETGWLGNFAKSGWDAVIYDYIYAIVEIKKMPDLRIIQFNIKPIEYSIIIPNGNQDLLKEIDKQIAVIKESPLYENLYKKYFSTERSKVKVKDISDCPGCHIVISGETLGKIAEKELGDSKRYPEIFELNKDRIASPHLIFTGTKLLMPKR